jgi:arylsulfatase A-like enzyme
MVKLAMFFFFLALSLTVHSQYSDNSDDSSGDLASTGYQGPWNVLVLNVDDLRPSLGAFGIEEVISPTIDNLAQNGVVFRNAMNQISICGPSRSSFMTSKTPDSLNIWNFMSHIRVAPGGNDLVTIAEHFKNQGYLTTGGGKSFHDNLPPNYDGLRSWSMDKVSYLPTSKETCTNNVTLVKSTVADAHPTVKATAVCPIDRPDNTFFEYQLADKLIEGMHYAVDHDMPFLLWGGFFKPHHPSLMPMRIWNMYNVSNISIPKNFVMDIPEDYSEPALFNYVQGRQADSPMTNLTHTLSYGPNVPLPDRWIQLLRTGYYAGITWSDTQIKRVLDELDNMNLRNKTIVILFGDNAISMGENSKYMKSDNWDMSCRVPLIVSAPFLPKGKVRMTPVELLDVFPTLVKLTGVTPPPNYEFHGKDISDLMFHENYNNWDKVAYSQFPRCVNVSLTAQPWLVDTFAPQPEIQWNCMTSLTQYFVYMGYTVRSRQWRYTEWRKWSPTTLEGDWTESGVVGRELYDHRQNQVYGPSFLEEFETVNVYKKYKSTGFVQTLKGKLRERFDPNYI